MKFDQFQISTTDGRHVRHGIVGEHWAIEIQSIQSLAHGARTAVTDLASGHKSEPVRLTPIDAVLLIQRLDARGPASTTDAALNADVVEMLRPFFEAP